MKHWLLSVLLMVCSTVSAQITLVKDNKVMLVSLCRTKCQIMQDISGALENIFSIIFQKSRLPIEYDKTSRKGDILIGGQTPQTVTEDGFSISTQNGILRISGKKKKVVWSCRFTRTISWSGLLGRE